jgi:hypothetical protein
VLLAKQDIRRVIDTLPEPTKSIVMLMVVGSLRIGEVIAFALGENLSGSNDPNNTNFNFGIVSPGAACQGNTPRRGQAFFKITF